MNEFEFKNERQLFNIVNVPPSTKFTADITKTSLNIFHFLF